MAISNTKRLILSIDFYPHGLLPVAHNVLTETDDLCKKERVKDILIMDAWS
jgi:hypothetical protein